MTTNATGEHDDAPTPEAETLVDALFDYEVLIEEEDGTVRTSEVFEHRRSINNDTYLDMDEETLEAAVSDVFDVPAPEVHEQLEAESLTPEAVSTFFALKGHVDELDRDQPDPGLLAAMAEVVVEVEPKSPVPPELQTLDDEGYRDFIDDAGDAVIIVFKRECEPCEATKDNLQAIAAAAPDSTVFAGVNAADVPGFLREFEVEAAPTSLIFVDGELAASLRGHRPIDTYQETFAEVYR